MNFRQFQLSLVINSFFFKKGIYKISQWSDIVNAHSIAGPGCIEGLKQVSRLAFLVKSKI